MPIYEYRCRLCGQEHEVLQKVTEPPLTDCPSCGKPGLQKVLTAAGFQLKGSGWYATDFKGGKKPAEKKTEAKTEAKTETKSETKKETKSDAKPASTAATSD